MNLNKVFAILLAVMMVIVVATACVPSTSEPATSDTQTQNTPALAVKPGIADTPVIDPIAAPKTISTKPLVVGYSLFNQKFSPFFAYAASDIDAVKLTQVSLLTTDRSGQVVHNAIKGETIQFNGVDYSYSGIADVKVTYDETADITTYSIKIRDDIKFSDGHVMDADDIIFSWYVLSDPAYRGDSPFNTCEIIGMRNYRLNNSKAEELVVTQDELDREITNPGVQSRAAIEQFNADFLASELDWVKGLYDNASYKKYTNAYLNPKDLFAYFYSIDQTYDSSKAIDEAQVFADIVAQYGTDFKTLGNKSSTDFIQDIEAIVGEILLKQKLDSSEGKEVPNIEGIRKLSQTEVEVKAKSFEASAIYNICGIQVAPLHYYGDEKQYDYANNRFGFPRGDLSIIEAKTAKPMGAGPYKFIKYENRVIYYEANENYYKGVPQTKFLWFKELTDDEMIPGIGSGTIDLACQASEKFSELKAYNSNGEITGDVTTTRPIDELAYGYIGICAKNVNVGGVPSSMASKNLRKAFATIFSVNRDAAIDFYYGDAASIINYPISNSSWAAPQKSDAGYQMAYSTDVNKAPIYTSDMSGQAKLDAALKAAIGFLKAAGFTFDETRGRFTAAPAGAKLEYEIIIPAYGVGAHPAYAVLTDSRDQLKKIGITLKIKDIPEANVFLDSLNALTQEMWAAAWSAPANMDICSVYHSSNTVDGKEPKSNYYYIRDPKLDEAILSARQSLDQAYRKATYKKALDIILDWGVEIPTYQRQNMVVFSKQRINTDTITPDITAHWDWIQEIEKVEMNQ
ncbi:MAG: ABC transporter substrate-binding protein [Thermoclostridium sp.]|nr:ABC transporter substrate-binding protein [Thermoclostridium sp.]